MTIPLATEQAVAKATVMTTSRTTRNTRFVRRFIGAALVVLGLTLALVPATVTIASDLGSIDHLDRLDSADHAANANGVAEGIRLDGAAAKRSVADLSATDLAAASSLVAQASADVVDVIGVSGYLDAIMADFIKRSIDKAETSGSLGLVLQVNSSRATISDDRLIELGERIANSKVPVTMWIGPSGAAAAGGAGQLAGLVSDLALAPGSELGDLGEPIIAVNQMTERFAESYPSLQTERVSSRQAIELGIAREAPTLPFFVIDLPGFETEIDDSGSEPVRVPVSAVRFAKLSQFDQFMHAAASPAVAYLLFIAGVGLLVFELFTGGVGIAGGLGAACLLLGCYGLAALPTREWAVALLLLAMFGYAVDIQTGVPRVWTVIATLCLVTGSLALFEGQLLSWITLLAGVVGTFMGMVAGMPAMVRTRYGTPRIGRDWMIGAVGVARGAVSPEGVVMIEGAPWRARTQRATPIAEGDPVTVVDLEGLILTVEPAEAAAVEASVEPVDSGQNPDTEPQN